MRIKDVLGMIREMMGNKVQIEYTEQDNEEHYDITPYSFQPKFARKVTDNHYVDLGQGILELLDKKYNEKSRSSEGNKERI